MEEYGYCLIDGHKEKIGNFRIEPPSLFRGRGDHPKMGMLKKRVLPKHVIINCSKDAKVPEAPGGQRWKEVRYSLILLQTMCSLVELFLSAVIPHVRLSVFNSW